VCAWKLKLYEYKQDYWLILLILHFLFDAPHSFFTVLPQSAASIAAAGAKRKAEEAKNKAAKKGKGGPPKRR
jgi:hypothetical protein